MMNISATVLFLMSSVLLASCPLGFPPEDACPEGSPSCALYVDGDGDALCDNPGPQPVASSEQSEESPSDTSETVSDSLDTETGPASDSLPEPAGDEISLPDDTVFTEVHPDTVTWAPEPSSADSSETVEVFADSSASTGEIQIDFFPDSVSIDTVTLEETIAPALTCPLGYSPEQACPEDSPFCAFFIDADIDLYCDNPVALPDSSTATGETVTGRTNASELRLSGCPLGLAPETACPSPDKPLCPNFRGWNGCTNPGGGGIRRTLIVLIATAVLLLTATILKRHFRGRRKKDRHKRKIAHITVQIISLTVLGFLVQGCFCPLGVMQYALLPGGLIFLGGLGIAVLILPILWSAFFDRVYCGWVCPFGALQDLLGKLNVPRPPKFSHRVHVILSGFRYLLGIAFFSFLLLVSSGQFESSIPTAFFCKYDPFHTIFSFFIVGSFVGAIAAMAILVFFPRFFCKYLCFYGAILSFLGRIGLWKRFTRKHFSHDHDRRTME
ncbi:MAG: 4Fe-4S binding protein [Candidatus Aegiribacteria sp.]|nr:4Fe-4S binding protein [Candidatus Aegiribacteria sp.]